MAAAAIPAVIAAGSLAFGLKRGITQGVLTGNPKAVQAGFTPGSTTPKALPQRQPVQTQIEAPFIDSEKIKKAQTNRFLDLQRRTGRSSTLLTNQPALNNTFG